MLFSCWIAPAGFVIAAWILSVMLDATSMISPRLWLISGSFALSTSPIAVPGCLEALDEVDDQLQRLRDRAEVEVLELREDALEVGALEVDVGRRELPRNQSLLEADEHERRRARRSASVRPERNPAGASASLTPKPPLSVPLKKPVVRRARRAAPVLAES